MNLFRCSACASDHLIILTTSTDLGGSYTTAVRLEIKCQECDTVGEYLIETTGLEDKFKATKIRGYWNKTKNWKGRGFHSQKVDTPR